MAQKKHYMPAGFFDRPEDAINDYIIKNNSNIQRLANRMGVSRSTFWGYLTEKRTPSSAYLADLCQILNISADWLLFGGDNND